MYEPSSLQGSSVASLPNASPSTLLEADGITLVAVLLRLYLGSTVLSCRRHRPPELIAQTLARMGLSPPRAQRVTGQSS